MAVREFIGARYITKFAEPIEWDANRAYEAIEAVQYAGFTYISKQPVPVGVDIANEDFWLKWADPNAQMEQLRKTVETFDNRINERMLSFDTVSNMKVSSDLYVGAICRTSGFHNINDGGGAFYKITDDAQANEMDIITCGNLYAVMLESAYVTPEMYGAYGDGKNDDSIYIQRALTQNYGEIIFTKEYNISQKLECSSNQILSLYGKIIANVINDSLFSFNNKENITINGYSGIITGTCTKFFDFIGDSNFDTSPSNYCRNIHMNNIAISGNGTSVYMDTAVRQVFINNCIFYSTNGLLADGKCVEITIDNTIIFINGNGENYSIKLKSELGSNLYNEGWHISNCTIDGVDKNNNISLDVSDIYVFALTNSYIGTKFNIKHPTTSQTSNIEISNCVVNSYLTFVQGSSGNDFRAVISGCIFNYNITIQQNAYDIDIINCRFIGSNNIVAIAVSDNCGKLLFSNINIKEYYASGIVVNGTHGGDINANNIYYTGNGQSLYSARLIGRNPTIGNQSFDYKIVNVKEYSNNDVIETINNGCYKNRNFLLHINLNLMAASDNGILEIETDAKCPIGTGASAKSIPFKSTTDNIRLTIPFYADSHISADIVKLKVHSGSLSTSYHSWIGITWL